MEIRFPGLSSVRSSIARIGDYISRFSERRKNARVGGDAIGGNHVPGSEGELSADMVGAFVN
jgi:hypothetical protein